MTSAPALSAWTTASTKVPTHFSGQRMASPPKLSAATFRFAAALLRRRRLGKGTALGSVPVAAAQRRSAAVRAGLGQWPAPLEPKVFCTCARMVRTSTPFCYGSARALLFADVKRCWSRVPLEADMAHAALLFRTVSANTFFWTALLSFFTYIRIRRRRPSARRSARRFTRGGPRYRHRCVRGRLCCALSLPHPHKPLRNASMSWGRAAPRGGRSVLCLCLAA